MPPADAIYGVPTAVDCHDTPVLCFETAPPCVVRLTNWGLTGGRGLGDGGIAPTILPVISRRGDALIAPTNPHLQGLYSRLFPKYQTNFRQYHTALDSRVLGWYNTMAG